jgi:hypothetical protein
VTALAAGADRCPPVGSRALRHRSQVLDDLLVQFDARQDRQKLRRPPRHVILTPLVAGGALADVGRHGQPQVTRQYQAVALDNLVQAAVTASVGQYLRQLPAPGSLAARPVLDGFRGHERGDLESAQYRLAVLAAQPPGHVRVGAKFPRGIRADQRPSDEQVVHPLPRFGQRGHDLLQPAPQRRPPLRRTSRIRLTQRISSDAGLHRTPVDGIGSGRNSGRELAMGRDAEQPVAQALRARQFRGVSHRQIGDDQNVTRCRDRGVGIGPEPFGAPAQHRVAMLADHVVERHHAGPFRAGLPDLPDQRGIGLSLVVRGREPHFIDGRSDLPTSTMSQFCNM